MANALEFEYYRSLGCKSGDLSAVMITQQHHCYNLNTPAKSFHIGGPTSEKQIPSGCTVYGYADRECRGHVNAQIPGPSHGDQCYETGIHMGTVCPVRSVIYKC